MTSPKSKEEAVTVARAVLARSQEMDALAKKLSDDDMVGLECSETVQLERLAAANAAAARMLAAWVVEEHG
jgi:hypothetical protein